MKKSIILMAAALMAFTACQKDEVVSSNNGDAISFNPVLNNATKATATTATSLTSFVVNAMNEGTTTAYFKDVTFTKNTQSNFTSAKSYYWPAGNLDFYAYAPASSSQITYTDYKTFTVTPADAQADQVDLIYAYKGGCNKSTNGKSGVSLNFRHAESQICVKVKNTSSTLKFVVDGWKLVYLSKSGTFTYATSSATATHNDGTSSTDVLAAGTWSDLGTAAVTNFYKYDGFTAKNVAAETTTAVALDGSMILVPQTTTAATDYVNGTSSTVGDAMNGSYIAVKVKILNSTDDTRLYPATDVTAWACWPVAFNWKPGYKYIYTVDLAGGGYYEENTTKDPDDDDDDNPTTNPDDLDPILDTPIFFSTVTVDEFYVDTEINLDGPATI